MPKRIRQRIARVVACYLLVAWGMSWAAITSTPPDLLGLPWVQAVVGCGVAWLGGFAATLGRKLASMYENRPFHSRHEFARDGSVSVVVGLAGYMAGLVSDTDDATLALALLLAGYLGVRLLTTAADKLLAILLQR